MTGILTQSPWYTPFGDDQVTEFERLLCTEIPSAYRVSKTVYQIGNESDAPLAVLVKRARADREDRPFTVAVDLDGTLAEIEEPFDPSSIGKPRTKTVTWVRRLRDAGARIVVFTVRGDNELVKEWLDEHDVPYDYINDNPDQPEGSSGKIIADVYWDDRGYNAENPDEHGPTLLRMAVERAADVDEEDEADASDREEQAGTGLTIIRHTTTVISMPQLLHAMESDYGPE